MSPVTVWQRVCDHLKQIIAGVGPPKTLRLLGIMQTESANYGFWMIPLRSLRGRPKSEYKKLLVSVRYSTEVVAYFKSTGEGWQSRMDGVLRQYVSLHSRNA